MAFYAHSLRSAPRSQWHLLAEHLEATGDRAGAIAAKWGAEAWGRVDKAEEQFGPPAAVGPGIGGRRRERDRIVGKGNNLR